MNHAVCTNCESDDVEYIGLKYGEDEYYCHDCETYFTVNWDEQDALDAQGNDEDDEEYEEEQY